MFKNCGEPNEHMFCHSGGLKMFICLHLDDPPTLIAGTLQVLFMQFYTANSQNLAFKIIPLNLT